MGDLPTKAIHTQDSNSFDDSDKESPKIGNYLSTISKSPSFDDYNSEFSGISKDSSQSPSPHKTVVHSGAISNVATPLSHRSQPIGGARCARLASHVFTKVQVMKACYNLSMLQNITVKKCDR